MKIKNIILTNDQSQLELLSGAIENIASEWDIPLNISLNLNLVLEELFSNIIFYGYDDDQSHEINIEIELENSSLRIKLEDDAKEFNPLLVPEPDMNTPLEDRKIGGLGIFFVRRFMDTVTYSRINNKNILTLTKEINNQK